MTSALGLNIERREEEMGGGGGGEMGYFRSQLPSFHFLFITQLTGR